MSKELNKNKNKLIKFFKTFYRIIKLAIVLIKIVKIQ